MKDQIANGNIAVNRQVGYEGCTRQNLLHTTG